MAQISGRGDRGPTLNRVGGPTLWDILTNPDLASSASVEPLESIRRDVLRNIQKILNTRQGRCMGHPDYGMPEGSEFFVSPRGLERLARQIGQTIERWEPRVASPVQVRVAQDPGGEKQMKGFHFRAVFTIRAKLAAPWNELCVFRTTVRADGQSQVEG